MFNMTVNGEATNGRVFMGGQAHVVMYI